MRLRVAVAGGTGLTGRAVVRGLAAAGHDPVVLARSAGVDLVSGAGLGDALAGADAVIDVSNVTTMRRRVAVEFFGTAGQNLLRAGERAGVRHHVALSIVGIERVELGYYDGKRRQEEVVAAGPVPWTVLRATQFHEFADHDVLGRGSGPVVVVPRMVTRPIAVREVADALVALVAGPPAGMAPELAGPGEELMIDVVRRVRDARGLRRLVVPVRLPGAAGRAMAAGALLPTGPGPRGVQSFDDWLVERFG